MILTEWESDNGFVRFCRVGVSLYRFFIKTPGGTWWPYGETFSLSGYEQGFNPGLYDLEPELEEAIEAQAKFQSGELIQKSPRTYRDLKTWIESLTEEQKDMAISIYSASRCDFFPVHLADITDRDDVDLMEPGQPYLIIE